MEDRLAAVDLRTPFHHARRVLPAPPGPHLSISPSLTTVHPFIMRGVCCLHLSASLSPALVSAALPAQAAYVLAFVLAFVRVLLPAGGA